MKISNSLSVLITINQVLIANINWLQVELQSSVTCIYYSDLEFMKGYSQYLIRWLFEASSKMFSVILLTVARV